ncbi:MAG: hypothetical protein WC455_13290 [Dehalococcoidia bacterium]
MTEEQKKIVVIGGYHSVKMPLSLSEITRTTETVVPKCGIHAMMDGPRNRAERRKAKKAQRKRGR